MVIGVLVESDDVMGEIGRVGPVLPLEHMPRESGAIVDLADQDEGRQQVRVVFGAHGRKEIHLMGVRRCQRRERLASGSDVKPCRS